MNFCKMSNRIAVVCALLSLVGIVLTVETTWNQESSRRSGQHDQTHGEQRNNYRVKNSTRGFNNRNEERSTRDKETYGITQSDNARNRQSTSRSNNRRSEQEERRDNRESYSTGRPSTARRREDCSNPPCSNRTEGEGNNNATSRALEKEVCYPLLGCFGRYDFFDITNRPINFLPSRPESINIAFHLFTTRDHDKAIFFKYNASEEEILNSSFDPKRRTKFIVHGFIDKYRQGHGWMNNLKNLILEITPSDYNVFVVDWSGGSQTINYYQAVSNTRVVGAALAHFIKTLGKITGFKMEDIHIIGHSLGAHIAGYAGERIKDPPLGRITGLDPAGPSFYDRNGTLRLNAEDAIYVDNLHTDAGTSLVKGFGTNEPLGVSDFFPNGGRDQPGCGVTKSITKILGQGLVEGISHTVACSHNRATIMILEDPRKADKGCQFVGYPCESWEKFQQGECGECDKGALSCDIFNIWSVPSADPNKFKFKHNITSLKPDQRKLYFKSATKEPFCLQHYQIIIQVDKKSVSAKGIITLTINGTKGDNTKIEVGGGSLEYKNGLTNTHLYAEHKGFGKAKSVSVHWKFGGSLLTKIQGVLNPKDILLDKISINYLSNIKPEVRKSFSSVLCPREKQPIKSGTTIVFTECERRDGGEDEEGNGGHPKPTPGGGRGDGNRGNNGGRGNDYGERNPNRDQGNRGTPNRGSNPGSEGGRGTSGYPNTGSGSGRESNRDTDQGAGRDREPGRNPDRGSNDGRGTSGYPYTGSGSGRESNRDTNQGGGRDREPGRNPDRGSNDGRGTSGYPNTGGGRDKETGIRPSSGSNGDRGSRGNRESDEYPPSGSGDGRGSNAHPSRGSGGSRESNGNPDRGSGRDRESGEYPNRGSNGYPIGGSGGDRGPSGYPDRGSGGGRETTGYPSSGSSGGRDSSGQPNRGFGGDREGGGYPNRGSNGVREPNQYPNRASGGGREAGEYPGHGSNAGRETNSGGGRESTRYPDRGFGRETSNRNPAGGQNGGGYRGNYGSNNGQRSGNSGVNLSGGSSSANFYPSGTQSNHNYNGQQGNRGYGSGNRNGNDQVPNNGNSNSRSSSRPTSFFDLR